MNTIAKNSIYNVLNYAGVLNFARRSHRNQVLILTYHGILQPGSESYVNRNCVSAEMFDAQMRWLKKNYQVLSISEILDALQGKRELPPFSAGITFDDGFRNNYTFAFPILVKYGFSAAIFLTTDFIGQANKKLWTERVDACIQGSTARRLSLQMNGNLATFDVSNKGSKEQSSDHIRKYLKSLNPVERNRKIFALEGQIDIQRECIDEVDERYAFLAWEEIRNMAEAGIEFGSHTASHAILSTLSPEGVESELSRSKAVIEEHLQKSCDLFSYPNGMEKDYTKRDQKILQKLGYRAGFSLVTGFNAIGENPYALKRVNIARSSNFSFFLAKISGIQPMIKKLV